MDLDRNYILDRMKSKAMSISEFNYERLMAPPLLSLLSPQDIEQLHYLATSIRYSAKTVLKMKKMDEILQARGFRKMTGGTNRVVYKFLEDDSFVLKVATDAVGVKDNPREFENQFYYKPFVTKVFEVSPCGTVGLFERVVPITSRDEFFSVASDIYDVISNWFIGEYVMDDIGSKFFMNWGIRRGFGPVLLDFPYSYKLDGNKLYCNAPINNDYRNGVCGGVIDYDDGFNFLRCTKCGVHYKATELKKAIDDKEVVIREEERSINKMKVSFGYGTDVKIVKDTDDNVQMEAATVIRPKRKMRPKPTGSLKIRAGRDNGGEVKSVDVSSINNETPKYEYSTDTHGMKVSVNRYSEDDIVSVTISSSSDEATDVVAENTIQETATSGFLVQAIRESIQSAADAYEPVEAETDEEYDEGIVRYSAALTDTSELDHNIPKEDKERCIALTVIDENGNVSYLCDEVGRVHCIMDIDGVPLNDLVFLTKEAHTSLVTMIERLKTDKKFADAQILTLYDELDRVTSTENDGEPDVNPSTKDNGTRRDRDEKGRFISSKSAKEEAVTFDTSSPLIPESDEVPVPVGAVAPKAPKKSKKDKGNSGKRANKRQNNKDFMNEYDE